jgi:hypothetical protein
MLFGIDDRELSELEMPAEESGSWRYGPSVTILSGPGCYAFQVDRTTFSEAIVFQAVHELEGKPQKHVHPRLACSKVVHGLLLSAGGGIRTHTPSRAEDFKSPASTVPPPRRGAYVPGAKSSGSKPSSGPL